jgi:hypothetical protein
LLVSNLEAATLTGNDPYHLSNSRDGWIAREADGSPSQKLLNAWRFIFGDSDADLLVDERDNCALVANADQANTDGDAEGNACDADDDNDTVADAADNCALVANADQANTDGDAEGNACDADDDNDTVTDGDDNCALVPNAAQTDTDGDRTGDACDPSPRGPAGQISDLIDHTLAALDRPALAPTFKASLETALRSALARNPQAACIALRVYELAVFLAPSSAFTTAEKQALIAESRGIRADLGCG